MKPEIVQCYKTVHGQKVDTLKEWQLAGVFALLVNWKDTKGDTLDSAAFAALTNEIVEHGKELVEILSVVERGRPKGTKNKSKKPTTPTVVPAPAA